MGMSSGEYILPLVRAAITGGGDPSHWKAMNSAQEERVTIMKEEVDA